MAQREPTELELEALRQLQIRESGGKAVVILEALDRCKDQKWVSEVSKNNRVTHYRLTGEGRNLLVRKQFRLLFFESSSRDQPVREEYVFAITSAELTEKALGLMEESEKLVTSETVAGLE